MGTDGTDGIKTGWVPQSGGCFVFAAPTVVGDSSVSLVGAVLGERGREPVPNALSAAERSVVATEKDLTRLQLSSDTTVATLRASNGHAVDVVTNTPISFVTWHGAALHLRVRAARSVSEAVLRGHRIGSLRLGFGDAHRWVGLHTTSALSAPSLGWRLLHL